MNKLEVQQRVLKDGKLLDLDKFTWDESTRTFSSTENGLVFEFKNVSNCTFKTEHNCTFKTGSYCIFNTGSYCTFNTRSNCTFDTGSNCTFDTGSNCIFKTSYDCTFDTGSNCTFDTGSNCTFKTSYDCTFNTLYNCTFKTGSHCTFNTESYCVFKTGENCTFKTSYDCTFKTGENCTFKTGSYCTFNTENNCTFNTEHACTFKTGSHCTFKTLYNCSFDTEWSCTFETEHNCVVIRRDMFEVILLKEDNQVIQLCPFDTPGYLIKDDDKWYLNGNKELGEHIIVDRILSKVISRKGNIYKVVNYGKSESSYIVKQGELYSHGSTLKEAYDSLMYKISNRDTSEYENMTLDTVLSKEECIKMYRIITGACEQGTKMFVESLNEIKDEYTVKELIELTNGQYGNETLKEFIMWGNKV